MVLVEPLAGTSVVCLNACAAVDALFCLKQLRGCGVAGDCHTLSAWCKACSFTAFMTKG